MDYWTILGFVAGALTSMGYVPQIVKGYNTKRMADVSLTMPAVLGFGMFLWLMYGLGREDLAIVIANIVGCTLTAAIVLMKLHYDRMLVQGTSPT